MDILFNVVFFISQYLFGCSQTIATRKLYQYQRLNNEVNSKSWKNIPHKSFFIKKEALLHISCVFSTELKNVILFFVFLSSQYLTLNFKIAGFSKHKRGEGRLSFSTNNYFSFDEKNKKQKKNRTKKFDFTIKKIEPSAKLKLKLTREKAQETGRFAPHNQIFIFFFFQC